MHYFCFFILSLSIQVAFSQGLPEAIDSLIQKQLPNATVGVLVKEVETEQIIYSKNADKLLYPASGMKLFTAAASFYQLKPTYRFLTSLLQKNQDVYLVFTGSPALTINDLSNLFQQLKHQGITTIEGNMILDNSQFKAPDYPGGLSYDDLGWYYAAPDGAIILNENAQSFEFITAKDVGLPVKVLPKSNDHFLTIDNQLITVNKEEEQKHCSLHIEIQSNNRLKLTGCLSQSKIPRIMQLAVPDPIFMAKDTIPAILKKEGIQLKGNIVIGLKPYDAKVIASIPSKDMTQLISHMLHESDNLYASSLTKTLGYEITKEGTYKQGAFAIKKILTEHTHLNFNQIELADGIGTRYNLVTPLQLVVLLTDLYQDIMIRPLLLAALPQAGVSGSLKDRMKKTQLEQKIWAKTGTMHDVSSLSGFIINPPNKTLIFSIIINGINKPIHVAKSLEEQILLEIMKKMTQPKNS